MKRSKPPAYGSLCLRPYLDTAPGAVSSRTGDLREHDVESKILGDRKVVVYLPPGYSDKDSYSYPFALLQDGQNIFDEGSAAFGVDWGVDETAERLIVEQQIRPVILVAVYNSPERMIEYTPMADPEHGGGGATFYEEFLVEELIPFLETRYSLSHHLEDRAVIGSSLGGLLALHLGWSRSKLFGCVGALSPSLWWSDRAMIEVMDEGDPPCPRPRIWIDGGTDESVDDEDDDGIPDLIANLRLLRRVLLAQGFDSGRDLLYREVDGGRHDEHSWSMRVGDVLKAFFPKRDPLEAYR